MKQIKFRAFVKDDPNGVMQEVLLLDPINQVVKLTDYGAMAIREIELMQYTGLKANDREIYEGDIVSCTIETDRGNERDMHVVSFSNGMFMLGDYALCAIEGNEPEVLGNIYENPELLN